MLKKEVLFFSVFVLIEQCTSVPTALYEQLEKDIVLVSDLIERLEGPCTPNPCQNDGKCTIIGNDSKCLCQDTYFGEYCEKGNSVEADILMTTSNESIFHKNVTYQNFMDIIDTYNWTSSEQSIFTSDEAVTVTSDRNSTNEIMSSTFEQGNSTEPEISMITSNEFDINRNVTNQDFTETTDSYNWTSSESTIFTSDENVTEATDGNSTNVPILSTLEQGNSTEPDILMSTSGNFIIHRNFTYENFTKLKDNYNWTSSELSIFTSDENVTETTDRNSTNVPILSTLEQGNSTEPDILMSTSGDFIIHRNFTELKDNYNWTSSELSFFTSDENVTAPKDRNSTNDVLSSTHDQVICETDKDCLNGGKCQKNKEDNFTCTCKPNFGGVRCQVNLPCVGFELRCKRMKAVCVVAYNRATCKCPIGKAYDKKSGLCKNICTAQKCLHGICEVVGKTYKCNCDQGYIGSQCEERETPPPRNLVPWFTVIAGIIIIACLLLVGMFCVICQIKRSIRSR